MQNGLLAEVAVESANEHRFAHQKVRPPVLHSLQAHGGLTWAELVERMNEGCLTCFQ